MDVTTTNKSAAKKKATPKRKVVPTMEIVEDDMDDTLDNIMVSPVKKN